MQTGITAEQINEARVRWAALDRKAKESRVETDKWVNGQLADFANKHGRNPTVGDKLLDEIDVRLQERDEARAEADAARELYDRLVRVQGGYGASVTGAARRDGVRAGNLAGAAFVDALQRDNAATQPSGAASLPSLLRGIGNQMSPQAAIDGTSGGSYSHFTARGYSGIEHRPTSILDLLPTPEDVPSLGGGKPLDFYRQTVQTSAAAVVAPLAEKPASTITLSREATALYTVATISEQVPRQLLMDFDDCEEWVNRELSAFVIEKCEDLVLSGSGTGEPKGILNTSGIQTRALGVDSRFGALRKAITDLEKVNVRPDAIVFGPDDWQDTELEQDAQGLYYLGGPAGNGAGSVWRIPAVSSTALAAGTVLLGNFALGCRWWRGVTRLAWSEAVGEDFKYNALRLVAETGFGFAVVRPSYFVTVTGF